FEGAAWCLEHGVFADPCCNRACMEGNARSDEDSWVGVHGCESGPTLETQADQFWHAAREARETRPATVINSLQVVQSPRQIGPWNRLQTQLVKGWMRGGLSSFGVNSNHVLTLAHGLTDLPINPSALCRVLR